MKIFIIFSMICAIALASKDHAHHVYHEVHKECMKELGVDYSAQEDPKAKCVANCVYTKLKIISADGHFNETSYSTDERKQAKACFETNKNLEACERAIMYYKCTKKATNELWITRLTKCAKETKTPITVQSDDDFWKEMAHEKKACFARCVLIEMHMIDRDHQINMDNINLYAAGYNVLNVEQIIETCNKEHISSDSCTQIAKRLLCLLNAIRKKP